MNPYQENLDIIKGFFKKKIVLLYAIFTVLPIFSILFIKLDVLIDTAKNLNDNQGLLREIEKSLNLVGTLSASYILFIFEILIAVIFLLFFVKAGTDDDTLKAPIGMFRVVSVIEIIVTAVITLAMVLAAFILSLYSMANYSALTSILFVPLMFASVPVILLYLFFQTLFSGTIKESVNSIYLQKRGAKPYAVMSAILAVVCIYYGVLFAIYGLPKSDAVIPLLIFLGLTAVKFIFGTALGFSYAKYIESFSDSSTSREENDNIIVCQNCGKPLNPDDYFCNHCGTPVEK